MTANRASERAGRRDPTAEAVLVVGSATDPGDGVQEATSTTPAGDVVLVTADGPRSAGHEGGDPPDAVIHLGAADRTGNCLRLRDLTGLSMRLEEALAAGDGGLVRFEALDSLVVACELPRLVRFLRAELPRVLTNGYGIRAQLDPAVVDRRAARAIAGGFDRCIDCRV